MSSAAQPIVQFFDETPGRERQPAFQLRLASEKVTVRELIRRRIEAEVADYNAQSKLPFRGLVQPTDTEHTLNGYRFEKARAVDSEAQVHAALEAFERNGFFVLLDDRQLESLDEEVVLGEQNEVSFLKLVPLVGG